VTIALIERAATLPAEASSYVDRQQELSTIRRLIGSTRLVTLTGIGGTGKTRLAVRAALAVRRSFADGVSFVDLSVTRDPHAVLRTVSGTLGVLALHGQREEDALAAYLRDRRCLLVLDNCEHVLSAAAELVSDLLRACPSLTVLATSREPLGVAGEVQCSVPSMRLPERDTAPIETLRGSEAVALFVRRALEVDPDFAVNEETLAVIADICRRLDGLPLAIELATARLRALSLRQVRDRLANDRYRLLVGGSRDVPDRHRTLLASLEWSHELCSAAEQVAWARLSVFSGSWELEAAEYVCAGDTIEPEDVLDALQGLVEKSIVVRDNDRGDVASYRMLESIRLFGADRLARLGELPARQLRHRDWYRALLARGEREWTGADQSVWLHRMYHDLPNIRSAIELSCEIPGEAPAALDLTVPAWRFCWWALGRVDELHDWLDRILAATDASDPRRPRAVVVRNIMAAVQQRAIDTTAVASARERAAGAGDSSTVALSWYVEALAAMNREDLDSATRLLQPAAQQLEAGDDLSTQILIWVALAIAYQGAGAHEAAEHAQAQVRAIADRTGELFEIGYLLQVLALRSWRDGDLERGRERAKDSIRLKRQLNDVMGAALGIETLGFIAASAGEYLLAAKIFGAGLVVWHASGASDSSFPDFLEYRRQATEASYAAIGAPVFDRAFDRHRTLSLPDALAFVLGEDRAARRPTAAPGLLTRRETQIADLVAEGLTNRQIASRLTIAQRTAEGHVDRILTKLGLKSRSQLAVWVIAQRTESDPAPA
jgi:non-specific serine/threonine protein kinase